MKLISAIALDNPREVNTKFGPRLVIDCLNRDTNEKFPIWRGIDDSYTRKYVIKNSPLTIGVDSKGKFNLIEDPALVNLGQPLPTEPVPVKPVYDHKITQNSDKPNDSDQSLLNPSQKREIASYISQMKDLYGYCLQQSESLGLEGEDKRTVATTLYLSAQKKFSL